MPQRQNFQTIPHRNISKGIDQRSSPNSVQPGFAEDIKNMDTNSTGFVEKRTGYQGYKGSLPLRMESVGVSGSDIDFSFNPEINLLLTSTSPVVVYGEILQSGTGTITFSAGSSSVTGSGTTAFTTELKVGSTIYVTSTGESQIVSSITDDMSLEVGAPFTAAATGSAFTHRTTQEYYWSAFENDSRKVIPAGQTSVFPVTHGSGTLQIAAGVVSAPTALSLDNYTTIPERLTVTSTTQLEVEMDNTQGASAVDFYVLTENAENTDVVTYRAAIAESLTSGSTTFTIPASTHGLPNLHIVPFIYIEEPAGNMSIIIPEEFEIELDGDVTITLNNATGSIGGSSTFNGQIVMIDAPGVQALEASYTSGDGKTMEFSGVTSNFNFYSFFVLDGSGSQVQVIPSSIFHDTSAQKVTVTFDTSTSRNVKLVYVEATVKSNVITVDNTNYPNIITDTSPSVSLWGIPHTEIVYQTTVPKGSWTNSIEEYSSQGNNKLVTGIGGNLCEEIGSNEGVTLPSYFSLMRRRTDAAKTIGPFFGLLGGKVRGIDSATVTSNGINFSSIVNNGDGTATFSASLGPRYGSLSDLVLSPSSTGSDELVITNAGSADYNGTHLVTAVSDTSTYNLATSFNLASVSVADPSVVFTFSSSGDATTFYNNYVSDGAVWSWKDIDNEVFIMTITDASAMTPVGATITATRGSSVTLSGPNSDFTQGQSTTFTDEKITLEATPGTVSITVAITNLKSYVLNETDTGAFGKIQTDSLGMSLLNSDGVVADLPYLTNDTLVSTLFTESPVIIGLQGNSSAPPVSIYLRNVVVNTLVPAAASINVKRTNSVQPLTSVANIVKGDTVSAKGFTRQFQVVAVDPTAKTITLDESIELSDDTSDRSFISVTGRWKFVEAPPLNDRPISYFDQNEINNQDRLRGVAINDSIFYTNYDDDVMKYDGSNLYRAGLLNWQPRTHSYVNTADSGIPLPNVDYLAALANDSVVPSAGSATGLPDTLSLARMPDLSGVSEIYLNGDDGGNTAGFYKIKKVDDDNKLIQLGTALSNSTKSGTFVIPQEIAYYFKLQLIDRNNNIVASAITDYQESVVQLTRSGKVTHRLTGFPKFDVYDYDRIDIIMYRSKLSLKAVPVFFEAKRVPIDFELLRATDSVIITDTLPDSSLTKSDQASIALKGSELPVSSEPPPRAKYIATADNRLVLGNIKEYNKLDITLISDLGITEVNQLQNTTIQIQDNEAANDLTFEFMALSDGTNLNSANNIEITSIDFSSEDSSFKITTSGSIGYSVQDKYIQLSSFFMEASATGFYTSSGRTRVDDPDVGKVIGWWKVKTHDQATNEIVIEYTHGNTSDFTFTSSGPSPTNPIYLTFPDTGSSNIPILAVPYDTTKAGKIISSVVYDDTTTAFKFTNAVNRGVRDLKMAFNRVMVDQANPWAYALSGVTEGNGRIEFRSALPGRVLSTTITTDLTYDIEVFLNNRRQRSGVSGSGRTLVYPSRLVFSPPNYPEMFDNPFGASIEVSDSLVDINANDGQEITGLSTFFADSTGSTAGQLSSTLLVFKNKSIYAVDLNTRQIQKLESMGQGCTVPDSISATRSGIMFANESGIYSVSRDLQVTYIGKWLERYWQNTVGDSSVIEEAIGYTDSVNQKYKLSVPTGTDTKNSEVAVLDYVVDDPSIPGSWTLYDNIGASGWIQTNTNSFFGNYTGQVFALRQAGDSTDYRDDATGISSAFVYGAQSFGDSGSRAVLNRVISHFQAETSLTDVSLDIATDMSVNFDTTDKISFVGTDPKVQSIASSVPNRHALYFQVRYTHDTLDENFVLSGIDMKVQGLGELGINQANEKNT